MGPELLVAGEQTVSPSGVVHLNFQFDGQILNNVETVVVNISGFSLLLGNNCLEKLKVIKILYKPGEPPFFSAGENVDKADLELDKGSIVCRRSQTIPAFTTVSLNVRVVDGADHAEAKMVEPSSKLMQNEGI